MTTNSQNPDNIRIVEYNSQYQKEIQQIFLHNFYNNAGLEIKGIFFKGFFIYHGIRKILISLFLISFLLPNLVPLIDEKIQTNLKSNQHYLILVFVNQLINVILLLAILFFILEVPIRILFTKEIQKYANQSVFEGDMSQIEENYMKNENNRFFMALNNNDQLCGFIAADSTQPQIKIVENGKETSQKALHLMRLSITENSQGKGLGKRLSQHVLDFAAKQGFEGVSLFTAMINEKATALYLKLGFTINKRKILNRLTGFGILEMYVPIKQ